MFDTSRAQARTRARRQKPKAKTIPRVAFETFSLISYTLTTTNHAPPSKKRVWHIYFQARKDHTRDHLILYHNKLPRTIKFFIFIATTVDPTAAPRFLFSASSGAADIALMHVSTGEARTVHALMILILQRAKSAPASNFFFPGFCDQHSRARTSAQSVAARCSPAWPGLAWLVPTSASMPPPGNTASPTTFAPRVTCALLPLRPASLRCAVRHVREVRRRAARREMLAA